MGNMLKYIETESVVDTIYVCSNIGIKFHVSYHVKNNNNKRTSVITSYSYDSNKYNDSRNLTLLYRNVSGYLTIENIRSTNDYKRDSVMILIHDMYYIRNQFELMSQILLKSFQRNSAGNIELAGVYEPVRLDLNGKFIEMIPIIMENNTRGVRVSLNSYENYHNINIDQFMAMKYIFDTFDIYGNAITLLNYVKPTKDEIEYINKENNSPFK